MRQLMGTVVSAVAALVCAGSAHAAIVDVTYTGLATGFDQGVFGAGQAYVNTPFVTHYKFDETDAYAGQPGGQFGAFLGADVTINGFTLFIPTTGTFAGDSVIPDYSRQDGLIARNPTPINMPVVEYLFIQMANAITTDQAPDGRTDPFSASGSNAPTLAPVWNSLQVETYNLAAGFTFQTQTVSVTSLAGTPTTGSGVFPAAFVPEPATWAMMLLGFFSLGAALRRRRAALVTA